MHVKTTKQYCPKAQEEAEHLYERKEVVEENGAVEYITTRFWEVAWGGVQQHFLILQEQAFSSLLLALRCYSLASYLNPSNLIFSWESLEARGWERQPAIWKARCFRPDFCLIFFECNENALDTLITSIFFQLLKWQAWAGVVQNGVLCMHSFSLGGCALCHLCLTRLAEALPVFWKMKDFFPPKFYLLMLLYLKVDQPIDLLTVQWLHRNVKPTTLFIYHLAGGGVYCSSGFCCCSVAALYQ